MTTTQVTLSEAESRALQTLSRSSGKTQEEILHEAVKHFLTHQLETRLAALRQARGIWKERQDLPNFAELRAEWDRL